MILDDAEKRHSIMIYILNIVRSIFVIMKGRDISQRLIYTEMVAEFVGVR